MKRYPLGRFLIPAGRWGRLDLLSLGFAALFFSLSGIASADTNLFVTQYWRMPVQTDTAIRTNLSPESCGECHRQQYEEWSHSVHGRAMGPGVIGQVIAFSPKEDASCRLCHAPLDRQQPYLFDEAAAPIGNVDPADMAWPVERTQERIYRSKREGKNPVYDERLARQGIVCAACHVRDGVVYGPPPDPAKPRRPSPHPVRHTPYFESAEFCRACHQFSPDDAINGKPLENTYEEWKHGSWGAQDVACQKCHMPGRAHRWKGIHDDDQVRLGLLVRFNAAVATSGVTGELSILNANVGHFFPTYVTPKVVASVVLVDSNGAPIFGTRREGIIAREVILTTDERREIRDSRIVPGDTFVLPYRLGWATAALARLSADAIRAEVTVYPDHFYTGLFEALLDDDLDSVARQKILQAHANSKKSPFTVFSETLTISQPHRAIRQASESAATNDP